MKRGELGPRVTGEYLFLTANQCLYCFDGLQTSNIVNSFSTQRNFFHVTYVMYFRIQSNQATR
jgi:hypothetical protein